MERFDVNCTLGRWPEGGPMWATTGQLLAEMERLGIGKALVRHTVGRFYDPTYGNQVLTEEIGGEERLFPCWTALPPNTGELGPLGPWLSNLLAADVRAICLYPKSHGYPLAEWQCAALLAPLAEQHMLLLLELSEVSWEEIHWLCKSYPKLQVVLLNTDYRVLRPLYGLLETHKNLYLDLSTIANFQGTETLVAHFGAGRFLLGTNGPRNDGAGIITALNYAKLSDEQIQAIAAGNLERLLEGVRQ